MIMSTFFFIYRMPPVGFLSMIIIATLLKEATQVFKYVLKFLNVYQLDNFYLLLQDTGILKNFNVNDSFCFKER